AFLPEIVQSWPQVKLWQSLDPVAFRLSLYQSDHIEAFRRRLYFSSLWDARLEPHALAYALIAQTARSCFVKVPPRVVASTYKAIGIGEPPDARELREATDFIGGKGDLTMRLPVEYGRMKPRLKRFDRPDRKSVV